MGEDEVAGVSSGWQPTVKQLQLAEALGSGYTLQKACEVAEVSYSTGHRWYSNPGKPEFIELVSELRHEAKRAYQERFSDLINLAMALEQRVLAGELSANDEQAKVAHDILSRTAYRAAGINGVGARGDESRRRHPRALPPPRNWPPAKG